MVPAMQLQVQTLREVHLLIVICGSLEISAHKTYPDFVQARGLLLQPTQTDVSVRRKLHSTIHRSFRSPVFQQVFRAIHFAMERQVLMPLVAPVRTRTCGCPVDKLLPPLLTSVQELTRVPLMIHWVVIRP